MFKIRIRQLGGRKRGSMMREEVLSCIRGRRSTRSFQPEQISPEQLDALLEAAIWAPSGGNSQTWKFFAIQNQEKLLTLNELVRMSFQTWVPDDDYAAKLNAKEKSAREGYNFYFHAPTLIVATNRPRYANAMADCATALQNIFLAAHAVGLGSCYINQLRWLRDEDIIRQYLCALGMPEDYVVCGAAAVGYIKTPMPEQARKADTVYIIR